MERRRKTERKPVVKQDKEQNGGVREECLQAPRVLQVCVCVLAHLSRVLLCARLVACGCMCVNGRQKKVGKEIERGRERDISHR